MIISEFRTLRLSFHIMESQFKGIDYCPIEIIKRLTDKGQFQYLTNLKGPQVGNRPLSHYRILPVSRDIG